MAYFCGATAQEANLARRIFHGVMGGLLSLMGRLRGLPEAAASNLAAITTHADRIIGAPARHLHERYSPAVHIDLLHYAPNPDWNFHYIVTSGMSDREMTSDMADGELPRLELVLALPAHWDVSPDGFGQPAAWQPVKLLKVLARYPHVNRTYLAKAHTIGIGDEPMLWPMKAVLLMPPVLIPEFRAPLDLGQGKVIHFLAPYLIHQDELEMKLDGRLDQLLDKFGERQVTELYDLQRPSVLV
jgi:Suppressor of fused protein (SUFU)